MLTHLKRTGLGASSRASAKRGFALFAGASLTILVSFATQWVILTHFGAGRQTDSYFAALAVPVVVLYVLSDPLNRVALPALSVHAGEEFWTHAWTTIEITVLIFLGVAVVLYFTAAAWVSLLVPGFLPDAVSKTILL